MTTTTLSLFSQLPNESKLHILNFLVVFFDPTPTNANNDEVDLPNTTTLQPTTAVKDVDGFMELNARFHNEAFLFENIQSVIHLSVVNSHWYRLMFNSRMSRLWKCCLYSMTLEKSLIKDLTRTCKQRQDLNLSILLKRECVKQWFSQNYCVNRHKAMEVYLGSFFPLDSSITYQKKKPIVLQTLRELLMADKRVQYLMKNKNGNDEKERSKSKKRQELDVIKSAPSVHSDVLALFCKLHRKYCRTQQFERQEQRPKKMQYSWWLLRDLLPLFIECGIRIYESFEFGQLGSPVNANLARDCFFSALNVVNAENRERSAMSTTILMFCLHDSQNIENELLKYVVSLLSEHEMDSALDITETVVDMPLEAYVSFRLNHEALSCLAPHIYRFRKSVQEPYSLEGLGNKFLSMFFSQLNIESPTNLKSIIKTMVEYCQLDLDERATEGDDFLFRWFSFWKNLYGSSSQQIDLFMLEIVLFLVNEMKMDIGTTNDIGNTIIHDLVRVNTAFHAVSPLLTNDQLRPHVIPLLSKENNHKRIPLEEHIVEYTKKWGYPARGAFGGDFRDYRTLLALCEYTDSKVCKERQIAPQLIRILENKSVSTLIQQQLVNKMA